MSNSEAATANYFIKSGYVANGSVITDEAVSGERYWTPDRLKLSLSYQHPVYALAGTLIAARRISRVVDVGCGVATKLERLHTRHPGVEFVGIDQPSTIAFCRQRYDFGRWVADNFEHPDPELATLTGDLVICADVIEHLGDPDMLLAYLRRRLSPGGIILLSTPERDLLRGEDCNYSPNKYHVREWNQAELARYLRSAGFVILQHHLQLPVRAEPTRLFFSHVVKRALRGRPVRWNQACVLQVP